MVLFIYIFKEKFFIFYEYIYFFVSSSFIRENCVSFISSDLYAIRYNTGLKCTKVEGKLRLLNLNPYRLANERTKFKRNEQTFTRKQN